MAVHLFVIAGCNESPKPLNDTSEPTMELPVFIQPTRVCRDPLPEEAAGQSDGEVCTWQAIAGATEEGRRFSDYADCNVVLTQRPYYPMPAYDELPAADPRMEDPAYVEELNWARRQVEAVGCSCCHSNAAPEGAVRWTIDAPGNWTRTMNDRDVAALADIISTEMFGRFPPEDNNGFIRDGGVPSTDPDRLIAFFADELSYRGLSPEDFADAPPTGGPLLEQEAYVPTRCEHGEGVDVDGSIHWTGGPARYIYILDEGSENPTVPPDLDLPEGTRWRIDVPHTGTPLQPGSVYYGEVPTGTTQKHPTDRAPAALTAGETYYLYVTRDVFQPITRCLFTAR